MQLSGLQLHVPATHVSLGSGHVPQEPPQPSSPQTLPRQLGVHAHLPATQVPKVQTPQCSVPPHPSGGLPHCTPSCSQVGGTHWQNPLTHCLPVAAQSSCHATPLPCSLHCRARLPAQKKELGTHCHGKHAGLVAMQYWPCGHRLLTSWVPFWLQVVRMFPALHSTIPSWQMTGRHPPAMQTSLAAAQSLVTDCALPMSLQVTTVSASHAEVPGGQTHGRQSPALQNVPYGHDWPITNPLPLPAHVDTALPTHVVSPGVHRSGAQVSVAQKSSGAQSASATHSTQ
jgi:hypothetical protein